MKIALSVRTLSTSLNWAFLFFISIVVAMNGVEGTQYTVSSCRRFLDESCRSRSLDDVDVLGVPSSLAPRLFVSYSILSGNDQQDIPSRNRTSCVTYLIPLLLVQSRDDLFSGFCEYLLGSLLLLDQTLLCIRLTLDSLSESTELIICSLSLVNLCNSQQYIHRCSAR